MPKASNRAAGQAANPVANNAELHNAEVHDAARIARAIQQGAADNEKVQARDTNGGPSLHNDNGRTRNGPLTVDALKRDPEVTAFLQRSNEFMLTLGYTEHGQRHAGLVGHIAENVLSRLNHPERTCHLANVAGYLHDIGNCVHREHHAQSGALIAYSILSRMGLATDECALVMNAIGNHEEERGTAITPVSAAVIIADKADVHRSRVQNPDMKAFDIHDRVNYASTRSFVRVRPEEKIIALELEIDTNYATVIEYFEIFLGRMTMMRQACEFLGCKYHLIINDTQFT